MTPSSGAATRTAALKAARQRDSAERRRRALGAIETLEREGSPVTAAAVARAAGVSTWLVYAEGVREHLEVARHRQASALVAGAPKPPGGDEKHRSSTASLRTDLALAREEITRLRAEVEKLRKRLRLHLGAEIEGPCRAELISRVADLEAANRQLVAERDARAIEAEAVKGRLVELEDELTAARESLRRVVRLENRGR